MNAKGTVRALDKLNNYRILTEELTYFKFEEKINSSGKTSIFVRENYKIDGTNIQFLIKKNYLSSEKKSRISDKSNNVYFLDRFKYMINEEILKGENIIAINNYDLPNSNKVFFSSAIIDLKNQKFSAADASINMHKNIFNNSTNDPRLKGISAKGDANKTELNRGIFTSCNKDQDCPPWSIKADKIIHDKEKKQITYEDAVLNIYDIPVLYFPKFFHPDPTVNRQSGFLKPKINNSNILGSSITVPYFKKLSDNKDLTFTPSLFDSDTKIAQLEYREINENTSIITDIGLVNNFKSKTDNKSKNLNHFFGKFNLNLDLKNFLKSDLTGSFELVSEDNYLKVFDNFITNSELRPRNFDKLTNNLNLNLVNADYSFETGLSTYKTLDGTKNDKYQYILPYYSFEKYLSDKYLNGSLTFKSIGSNDLNSTNRLDTSIINDLNYESKDYISKIGLKKNFKVDLKNSNVSGKNSPKYKSSPQSELVSLLNAEMSLPLIKDEVTASNILIPKLSFRLNPTDMKNYSDSDNTVDVNNIFSNNRLGLSDTYESGRSVTLGLDYKREHKNSLDEINKYFELKLATVLRDKEEKLIPKKTTLNRKQSNLFGSIESKITNKINLKYNFSIDNDYSTFEKNDLSFTILHDNLSTTFNFLEEQGELGDSNIFETKMNYVFDKRNSLSFSTRRNRKINLTEYYDLVYEYKYDCLTAGIKYNKKYYSDGDLKPSENLFFSITLFPLTNYEYDAKEIIEN